MKNNLQIDPHGLAGFSQGNEIRSGEGGPQFSDPHVDDSSLSRANFNLNIGGASSGMFNTIGMNMNPNAGFTLKEYNQTRLQFINS